MPGQKVRAELSPLEIVTVVTVVCPLLPAQMISISELSNLLEGQEGQGARCHSWNVIHHTLLPPNVLSLFVM